MSEPESGSPPFWALGVPPRLGTPLPRRMHALVIHRDEYGPPREALRLESVPVPRLREEDAGSVLVAVLATGPNFNTNFAALGLPVPVFGRGDAADLHIPGSDALGIVVDAGQAVAKVRTGQAVILDSWTGRNIRGYETHDGFNAQFAVVDEEKAIPLPPPLRRFAPERLAALLLTYGTAYRAVVERLCVSPGETVLVMGGGKGTSFAGAQIAKTLGARVILAGSNPALARSLVRRGMADAFIDRRRLPRRVFGPVPAGARFRDWMARTAPFRRAVLAENGGRPVDKVFEHTGGDNFPLLVSVLAKGGSLVFFGATGRGIKGEYRETFFYAGRRFVFDARWVWMRQKQILFRRATPEAIFAEIRLPPGRRGVVWGADAYARGFVRAALDRGAEIAVIASASRERRGIASLRRMGIPGDRILDRDAFSLPGDMPDPLTDDGRPNPDYNTLFLRNAQALGKALWGIFGSRTSPDFVVERPEDGSTLHYSAFIARDFDERDTMPCGVVVARGPADLSIRGSHMYGSAQASDIVRLLAAGRLVMEEGDVEVVSLPDLPFVQQRMLDGTMARPKGVALVQADRPGRTVADFEEEYLGERLREADPGQGRFLDIRLAGDVAVVTLTRPEALNALNGALLDQLAEVVRQLRSAGGIGGRTVRSLVLRGAGRAFAAGADVSLFAGSDARSIASLAAKNIALFGEIENLPVPVVALVDGFALGGGNELAMSAHYRVVTENARLGQPEVKLGIIPGYGGMQRLPRLVGPARAAVLAVNGEPVDGREAVSIGLADAFRPSATALPEAVRMAGALASGSLPFPRRDWDALSSARQEELESLLLRDDVRRLLAAPSPDAAEGPPDLLPSRRAAAREAIRAMAFGFANGFSKGLSNDARAFGDIAASPGGQEWIRRFLAKDPRQSSFLPLLPPSAGEHGPIAKKAPGDRQISSGEIASICALVATRTAEGKVADLPPAALRETAALLKGHPVPPVLERLFPGEAKKMIDRIRRMIEKGDVGVSSVDLEGRTGFPRQDARPACEVLLFRRGGEHIPPPRKGATPGPGAAPRIFVTSAFLAKARTRPHLLLQAVVHPILEWIFGLPHMVAVLCESALNALPGGEVSDLNRFIALEAGRDRDFAYFDRILGTTYEPDEFRMEELAARFGTDEEKIAFVVSSARALGTSFRSLMEEVLASTREEIARDRLAEARHALDEGDADGALVILRPLSSSAETPGPVRSEVRDLIGQAVRSYSLDADPAYEGLVFEKSGVRVEPWAGRKARELADLLGSALELVRAESVPPAEATVPPEGADPRGEAGGSRTIHVAVDLERPSAKFIDGHDRVHWVFEKSFVEGLLAGRAGGRHVEGIRAAVACRMVRDDAFPDEKLKIDRQFAVAVKGAIAGYRFYQSLPAPAREEMARFYESGEVADPLFRLFVSLGEESNPARAGHLIRRSVARTHSYNYVRYPDTTLSGRVVVITGGGTGMGRSLALEAALRGANVVVTGRRPGPIADTKADMDDLIRNLGLTNETLAVQGDVSDPKYVGEMFEEIERTFGRIDALYNNAGVSGPVEFGSAYQEEHFEPYREAVGIHLTGAWLASLEAARIMESTPSGGLIAMVGTFYSESIHRHVLHAYPGRLPYTCAQSAKLALGDYLAWMLAGKGITVCSLNPSAVSTDRIRRGSGVFDKGSLARARIGRRVSPEALEKETLERTVGHEFVRPRDFARVALGMTGSPFRRTLGGHRLPIGGVTYEQPPGVIPSPAALSRYPDFVGKVALVTVHRPQAVDLPLLAAAAGALARSGASVVISGSGTAPLESVALGINAARGVGMATVAPANLANPAEVQGLFEGLPRLDLLLHFTGSVDWKRPLTNLPFEEWSEAVDRFGYVPRLLCWQAERRMDRDGTDGTIAVVGPDMSGVPSVRERHLVQVFQAMLRPAAATEAMERALMRKAQVDGTATGRVSDINIGLILPGRTDGRNKVAAPDRTAASVLWLCGEGKKVSGAVLLPDEQNALAHLPEKPLEAPGSLAGRVCVVTGGIRNLGKEVSLRFAAEKATVVVASRRPRPEGQPPGDSEKARADLAAADAVLSRMRTLGGPSLWIDADVSRPARVRALIEETRNRFGRIDVFVNNAGAGGDFSRVSEVMREHRSSWEAILRSNFLGPWVAVAALREIMAGQDGGGTVVNVSTHYADHPYLFRTIYTVSKIALKALTAALSEPLARENVRIVDVAPCLIAGPRMDWVMRNFAGRFAAELAKIPDLGSASRSTLQDAFVRSFDRAPAEDDRRKSASSFLEAVRESRLPRARCREIEAWYGRIRDWFGRTVPPSPPSNEQVADAVLYAAKNAPFLEDPFVGVSSLHPFGEFGVLPGPPRQPLSGRPLALLAAGWVDPPGHGPLRRDGDLAGAVESELARAGARVTSLVEDPASPGVVAIGRPAREPGRGGSARPPAEKMSREIDLSDPRILEPWLDGSLLGDLPPLGAVLIVGTTTPGRSITAFNDDGMEACLSHLGKALNGFSELWRASRDGGHVVVVAPPPDTGEGTIIRAALRQIVRTAVAERHFLPWGKAVHVSLLSAPSTGGDRPGLIRRILEILSGQEPPFVEPVPVGRIRP